MAATPYWISRKVEYLENALTDQRQILYAYMVRHNTRIESVKISILQNQRWGRRHIEKQTKLNNSRTVWPIFVKFYRYKRSNILHIPEVLKSILVKIQDGGDAILDLRKIRRSRERLDWSASNFRYNCSRSSEHRSYFNNFNMAESENMIRT